MRTRLRNAAHLILPAIVFLIGIAAFLLLRRVVVPAGFGAYGHYRAPVLAEIRHKPMAFAGQAACADCHSEIVTLRAGGQHKGVSCEACHGPSAAHVADPTAAPHARLDTKTLCPTCHEKSSAKPAWFRQVTAKEHAGGEPCSSCHAPHRPGV